MTWKTAYRSIYYDGAPEPADPDLQIVELHHIFVAQRENESHAGFRLVKAGDYFEEAASILL